MRLPAPACIGLVLALSASRAVAQVVIGPAVRIDTGGAAPANETSIAAAPSSPLRILAAWNDYRSGPARCGVGLSNDGGVTWTDTVLRPPLANQTQDEGDPMTAYDPRTGNLWAGGVAFGPSGGVFVGRLEFGAAGLSPTVMAHLSAASDKGWMAAGPDPMNPAETHLYVAFNEGLLISEDAGDTWTAPGALGIGTAFLPRVGPAGELYIPFWTLGMPYLMWRSTDGGQTLLGPTVIANRMDVWTDGSDRVPGAFRVPPLQTFAVDPTNGDLHCIFCDTTSVVGLETNLDLYWTTSTDEGASWSVPQVFHGDSAPFGDQFFPWLEIDGEGRLHAVWFDTRETVQFDADPAALLDVYYAYSEDSGVSWTEMRLTDTSFSSADAGFNGTFFGDYLGLTAAGGRTTVAYPDTSLGSADVYVREIRQGPATSFCFGLACPCGNDDGGAGCGNNGIDGQTSTGALLEVQGGSAQLSSDDLVLRASGIGTNQFGLIFTSMQPTRFAFGAGLRCIDNPFFRYPLSGTGPTEELLLGPGEVVSIAQGTFGPPGQLFIGATWHYQAWYRDPFGPCGQTFNFTNGLSVTWE